MVKVNSISIGTKEIKFIITDFKNEINVVYSGVFLIFLVRAKVLLQRDF